MEVRIIKKWKKLEVDLEFKIFYVLYGHKFPAGNNEARNKQVNNKGVKTMTNREKMNELMTELNAGMGTNYTIDQLNRLGDNEFLNHWLKAEYRDEKDCPMYNQYTGFEGNVTVLASKLIGTARSMELRFQLGGQSKYANGLTFVRYLLAQYDAEAYYNFID